MPGKRVSNRVKKELVDENSEELLSSEEKVQNKKTQTQETSQTKNEKEQENSQFLKTCEELMDRLNKTHKENKDEIKRLMKLHRQEMRTAMKGARRKRSNKKTGFTNPEVVPEQLAKLVGVKSGTTMPRTELTGKIYKVLDERGLRYEKDRRVFRADKELMKIFNLDEYVNNITDPKDKKGFNFYNLQSYMADLYPKKEQVHQQPQVEAVEHKAPQPVQTKRGGNSKNKSA